MTLTTRTALELKYDGAIPAHLLETRTSAELAAGHHRSMIRFSETRVRDFTESLAKLEAEKAQRPHDTGLDTWIERAKANIADHQGDIDRHQAALAALFPVPAIAAE